MHRDIILYTEMKIQLQKQFFQLYFMRTRKKYYKIV